MRKIAVLLLTLAALFVGCGSDDNPALSGPDSNGASGNGSDHHGDGKRSCDVSAGPVELAAKNIVFDKNCLAVRADQPFTIVFDNQEALPHNVAVLASHDSAVRHFIGEIITGPARTTYQGPALPAGDYHFHCDLHPQMKGDFLVK